MVEKLLDRTVVIPSPVGDPADEKSASPAAKPGAERKLKRKKTGAATVDQLEEKIKTLQKEEYALGARNASLMMLLTAHGLGLQGAGLVGGSPAPPTVANPWKSPTNSNISTTEDYLNRLAGALVELTGVKDEVKRLEDAISLHAQDLQLVKCKCEREMLAKMAHYDLDDDEAV